MKKYVLVIISIITFGFSTELSGYFSGFLSVENSPYYITDDLIIRDSLVIEAGCKIYTNPNCRIATGIDEFSFDAYIRAEGTETDSIIFTHNPNQPTIGWGGLFLGHAPEKTSRFKYCTIENAAPIEGGNVYQGSGIRSFHTTIQVDNSIIQNNKINHYTSGGAGIRAIDCKIEITNSTIRDNTHSEFEFINHGTGLKINDPWPGSFIKNSIIDGNGDSQWGGGLGIVFSDTNFNVVNTVISNNIAWQGAGASIFFDSHPVFKNCIFYNNENWNPQSSIEFINIYTNSDFTIESSIINEEYCLFYDDNEGGGGNSEPNGYGCDHPYYDFINTDPMFVDADNGDFRLHPRSPAINAGTGDPDPDGSPPDIGPIYFHLTKGDVNFDENVTVSDIILYINYILTPHTLWESQSWSMDTNEDEEINILDIIQVVNVIMEG